MSIVVLLLTGQYCGACAAMEPIWHDFAMRPVAAQRLRLDVDDLDSALYKRYGTLWEQRREMPQVCWLDSGRLLERQTGLLSIEFLQRRTLYWIRQRTSPARAR